jgi:hypothetical protein
VSSGRPTITGKKFCNTTPVRVFNSVIQPLMSAMIGIRRQGLYRLDVAAKFIGHDNARWPKLPDKSEEEAYGRLGIAARLNQYVENITVSIDSPPEPEFLSANRDDASFMCHLSFGLGRSLRMQVAKWRPKRLIQDGPFPD